MEPKGRRVAVTGLGVIAPCGQGKDAYWRGLLGPGITSGRSTEIPDWDPTPWYASPKEARRADHCLRETEALLHALRHRGDARLRRLR
mgnify:CR=1 FL=1